MNRSRIFVSLAVLALAAGLPRIGKGGEQGTSNAVPSPPPDPELGGRFTGVFNYAGGPAEHAALDAAIERAASEFNFLFRPIVRSKLRDANTIARVVTFQWSPGTMRVMFTDPARDYRAPDDGTPIHSAASKDASTRISHRFERGTFIEWFTADDGAQRNIFTLTPDGQVLTMNVLVTSPKLKVPVQYSLTYRK